MTVVITDEFRQYSCLELVVADVMVTGVEGGVLRVERERSKQGGQTSPLHLYLLRNKYRVFMLCNLTFVNKFLRPTAFSAETNDLSKGVRSAKKSKSPRDREWAIFCVHLHIYKGYSI